MSPCGVRARRRARRAAPSPEDRLRVEMRSPRAGRTDRGRRVALVEDQVNDGKHGRKAVREQMSRWHTEGDTGGLDLALRAYEPLVHRRLRDEEGAGDLLHAQPAERPQCERYLPIELERRMATRENQLEPLVRDRRLVHDVLNGHRYLEQTGFRRQRPITANAIDRAVA